VRAAVCHRFREPLAIEEVELAPPEQGEVRVRVAACAICASDVAYAEGKWGGRLPAVYGHEASGIVAAVGPGVEGLRPGQHVVVTLIRSCRRCAFCVRGEPVLCEGSLPLDQRPVLRSLDGVAIEQGLRTAAFAEEAVVDASQVVPIPDSLPLVEASLLACSVLTGFGAVANTAQVGAGDSVAVLGTGGVGLSIVQAAALCGAGRTIAIDLSPAKLAAAAALGATDTLLAGAGDLVQEVRARTSGRGADYVFVSVGEREAVEQSFALVRRGGSIVLVGMPASGVAAAFDPTQLAHDGVRLLGCKMGNARPEVDIPRLVRLYEQGRLKLGELVSGRYPLQDINEAIASLKRGEALRNVIVFPLTA
jgi:Zn-dependent alcohol dehydrogenase